MKPECLALGCQTSYICVPLGCGPVSQGKAMVAASDAGYAGPRLRALAKQTM